MRALTWGLQDEEIKKLFPDAWIGSNQIGIGGISINNFHGDCGALTLSGCNTASEQSLKMVEEYASLSGFSKLFATIVTPKKYANQQLTRMKSLGWRCISVGNSNRNPEKRDYVMFKRIKCKYKGY